VLANAIPSAKRQPRRMSMDSEDERPTRPALNERDLLVRITWIITSGEERLDEPARVKQSRVMPAVKNVQHQQERQVVEIELIGPIIRMKRRILLIIHWRGLVSQSASTLSVGMVVCEKS